MKRDLESEICNIWLNVSKVSKDLCKGGLPDKHDCEWYHSSWCLLRCLGLVSNPFWHEKFYSKSILSLSPKKIAIVGTAGISMPYLVSKLQSFSELDIIDICATPLKNCETFAIKNNLNWKTIQKNIIGLSEYKNYDLIVNDAFLTRFPKEKKENVLYHIVNALNDNGYYITTIRKGLYQENGYKSTKEKRIDFVNRAIERGKIVFPQHEDLIKEKASKYIDNMVSYPVENIDEIKYLFQKVGLNIISIQEKIVSGESEKSIYYQVVSQKNN